MSDVVIRAEGVSKQYFLGESGRRSEGMRHAVQRFVTAPFRRLRRTAAESPSPRRDESFWALRDVTFDVARGQAVGIIGRNGAGKSTLLKILSRITEPTSGRIGLKGRVSSLLEVGTGFHPELTGRENIRLNGAILGMGRREIARKFDEIVTFAGVEPFLDTPVKRYSSGMYVRLAFAVAAHLEPDILIVDEVLAVGDAIFQRKCLGKMKSVSRDEGRTVLFVSHNMAAVSQLCDRAIELKDSRLVQNGPVGQVVADYLAATGDGGASRVLADQPSPASNRPLRFRSIAVLDSSNRENNVLPVDAPFSLRIQYEVSEPLTWVEMTARILTAEGLPVVTTFQSDKSEDVLARVRHGRYEVTIPFPARFFMPGDYWVNIAAHEPNGQIFDLCERVIGFSIADTGTNFARYNGYSAIGVVILDLPWYEHQVENH
jgi:lipopolysaccharide transport system ATP-binding protein